MCAARTFQLSHTLSTRVELPIRTLGAFRSEVLQKDASFVGRRGERGEPVKYIVLQAVVSRFYHCCMTITGDAVYILS